MIIKDENSIFVVNGGVCECKRIPIKTLVTQDSDICKSRIINFGLLLTIQKCLNVLNFKDITMGYEIIEEIKIKRFEILIDSIDNHEKRRFFLKRA